MYVCDYCGYAGIDPRSRPVNQIQRPMCAEPVTPIPQPSGLPTRPEDASVQALEQPDEVRLR